MKYAVILGCAVLALAAAVVRGGGSRPSEREAASTESVTQTERESASASQPSLKVTNERFEILPPTPDGVPPASGADREGNALPKVVPAMVALLDRELALTAVQRALAEEVLRQREDQVRTYHRDLRASKVFDAREYDQRTGRLRAESYQRIDSVLDGDQHRRFMRLVRESKLGDATAFEIDDDMVVLNLSN